MIERLVENWLDNAGERSYQRCFCQMLTGKGYRIVHNTEHTPLEFGKDVIAISPDGQLVGYQLKGNPGGTLKPAAYDTIRVQLEQLATLALTIPGLGKKVPDECYLVTNGEIDEAVYQQIQLLNASLVERGHPAEKIKTITRGTMLAWANELGLALWPSEMGDFGNLIRLLNYQGTEVFPAATFDPLLRHTLSFDKKIRKDALRRRVTSAAIMTAVALHSFSRGRNHYAEITAWMMFISYTIAACEKNQISYSKNCKEPVLVARDAIYDLLGLLCDEIAERPVLANGEIYVSEGNPFSEFDFYQPRALLLYMLMGVYWMWSEREGWKKPSHKAAVEKLIPSDPPPNAVWGEGALPHFITYLWYRKRVDATLKQDVVLSLMLTQLLRNKISDNAPLAAPYYSIEDVVRHRAHALLNCDDPFEGDSFDGTSYFAETFMMFLVRGNWKQTCKGLWPDFTRLSHENTIPDQPWGFCLFRADAAENRTQIYPLTYSWEELRQIARERSGADIPEALKADPILLLLFTNIFPYRFSFSAARFLHWHFDGTWFL